MNPSKLSLLLLLLLLIGCKKDPPLADQYINPVVSYDCTRTIFPTEIIENDAPVEGYTDRISYEPGDTIHFYVHTMLDSHYISISRYGISMVDYLPQTIVAAKRQNHDPYSYSWGCDWDSTFSYVLPDTSRSGMYAARLQAFSGEIFYVTFVVKPHQGDEEQIVVLASTNTWQGYNNWSGASFYKHELDDDIPNSQIVSFHRPNRVVRPYGNKGHLANGEMHLLRWLEKTGIAYSLIADSDFHETGQYTAQSKVVVLNSHAEYWTAAMIDRLEEHLAVGKNAMILSGNSIYWKVALACNRVEVRKNNSTHYYAPGYGGRWRTLNRPESSIIGVSYDNRGYDTYAPYRVIEGQHWVFAGTNLEQGDEFGHNGLNGGGASGWETDKITVNSPDNLVHLAKGINPDGGGADMVYFETAGGGQVFNVGSISYTGSLSVDSNVSRITRNVIEEFTKD